MFTRTNIITSNLIKRSDSMMPRNMNGNILKQSCRGYLYICYAWNEAVLKDSMHLLPRWKSFSFVMIAARLSLFRLVKPATAVKRVSALSAFPQRSYSHFSYVVSVYLLSGNPYSSFLYSTETHLRTMRPSSSNSIRRILRKQRK